MFRSTNYAASQRGYDGMNYSAGSKILQYINAQKNRALNIKSRMLRTETVITTKLAPMVAEPLCEILGGMNNAQTGQGSIFTDHDSVSVSP